MKKKFLILLLANILFSFLIIGIYAVGFEYDKANKLYPEAIQVSSDVSIVGFGQRWARFAQIMILIGVVFDIVVGFSWYKQNQKSETKFSILD